MIACSHNTEESLLFYSGHSRSEEDLGERTSDEEYQGFHCPHCGLCSIDVYFSDTGCPEADTNQPMFPFLDINRLCKVDRENLQDVLTSETKNMIKSFASLIGCIRKSLEKQEVTVEQLAGSVLNLGAFEAEIGQKPLLEEHKSEIRQARSIASIFLVLSDYTSFFNCEIIEHIIGDIGTDDDKRMLIEYKEMFFSFCKRSVFEVPPHVYGQNPSAENRLKHVAFKYTPSIKHTLLAVRSVRIEISKELGIKPYSLQLCSIKDGCIELNFIVPQFVQGHILKQLAAPDTVENLQKIGVSQPATIEAFSPAEEAVPLDDLTLGKDDTDVLSMSSGFVELDDLDLDHHDLEVRV